MTVEDAQGLAVTARDDTGLVEGFCVPSMEPQGELEGGVLDDGEILALTVTTEGEGVMLAAELARDEAETVRVTLGDVLGEDACEPDGDPRTDAERVRGTLGEAPTLGVT